MSKPHLKEMISQLISHELIAPCQFLADQAEQNTINRSKVVKITGIVHFLVQLHIERNLSELLVAPVDALLDQGVAKPECRGSKSISNSRIYRIIVAGVVTPGQ